MGDKVDRSYISFQVDRLEAEFERAREEADAEAFRNLTEELSRRKQTARVSRLRELLAEESRASEVDPRQRKASDGPATCPTPTVAIGSSPGSTEQTPSGRSTDRRITRSGPRRSGGIPPSFTPTPEQEQAVEAFTTRESLKINAYAGSGKTSTLQLLAHSTPRKGQYLAFNKKIVFDSRGKFPSDVDCATTHAMAFRSLKGTYTTDKLIRKITANQLVELLKLKNWRVDRNHVLAARSQAILILSTIRRFCQSAEPELLLKHVPRHGSLAAAPNEVVQQVAQVALDGAGHVWARMLATDDPVPLGHDGYLKVWALSEPRLPVDYILLDEAQDTNPVVLDVLRKQDAQIVYVGDKYQQIYEWRGAINAMEEAPAGQATDLTTSFRFGGEIAHVANRVLEMLDAGKKLKGNPERHSRIGSVSNGTVLARTNATTITAIIEALDEGKRPHLVGGTDDLIAMLRGVEDLKAGQPSSVPEFFGFENWRQVVEFVRSGEGEDLLTFVNLVEARGERQLLWALNKVADEDDCDFVVSTAHKAKGREWPEVRLMDDFLKSLPKKERGQITSEIDPSELRLLYVAITRAKDTVEVPSSLMQFLNTGSLPRALEPQATFLSSSPRRPVTSSGARTPRPPQWTPPANWRQSSELTARIRRPEPVANNHAAPPPPPSPPTPAPLTKKVGLFRRLFGR